MRQLLLLFLTLLSFQGLSSCIGDIDKIFRHIDIDAQKIPKEVETAVKEHIVRIQTATKRSKILETADQLDLSITDNYLDSRSRTFNIPMVATAYDISHDPTDALESAVTMAAHEFGHTILRKTLAQRQAPFKDYLNTLEEALPHLEKKEALKNFETLQKIKDVGARLYPDMDESDAVKKILSEKENLKAELTEELQEALPELEEIQKIISSYDSRAEEALGNFKNAVENLLPYEELFADLTAILFAGNNPRAVVDVLTDNGDQVRQLEDVNIYGRAFDDPKNNIDNWFGAFDNAHVFYAPVREHIYNRYLIGRKEMRDAEYIDMMEQIYKAIEKDLLERTEQGLWNITPIEANKRLIDKIEEVFNP